MLLAAGALVQVSGLNDLFVTPYIGFFRFVGGIAEPGFDRDVGSWGRIFVRRFFDIVG